MNGVTQKVGRITVAAGLMAFGAALLADNLIGVQTYTPLVIKLWPLLLIGFGAEYLIRSAVQREESARLRFDIGGAILLVLVVMLSVGVVSVRSWLAQTPNISFGFGPSQSRTESRLVSAQGTKSLEADVPVGSIRLEPNIRNDEIRVEATYSTHSLGLNRDQVLRQLDQIKLAVSEGETVKVVAALPSGLNDVSVHLVIYAPPGLAVKTETGAGSIETRGYKGDLKLSSRVGRIFVEAGSGSLTANSGAGQITVRHFEGTVAARTNVGSIEVDNLVGPAQLESGTGAIRIKEFQGGKLVAETRAGGIEAFTRALLEGDVALKTQTGQVILSVPKESSMRAIAQTRTGSLSAPPFMSVTQNGPSNSAVGTSGEGQYTVSLETNMGGIVFNAN